MVPGKAVDIGDQLKQLYSDGEEKPHCVRLFRYFDQEFNQMLAKSITFFPKLISVLYGGAEKTRLKMKMAGYVVGSI